MSASLDLRAIARRAAGRVAREFGLRASDDRDGGEAPDQDPVNPNPAASNAVSFVSRQCLEPFPAGGIVRVARGATITPLAREEAFRRGIRFVTEGECAERGGPRRVAVGCDHGGRKIKEHVLAILGELGVEALDLGTHDDRACDYPDFAAAVAEAVARGRVEFGVVIDGAGIGSAMAANKIPGVLAANCWDERTARNAREHNHANVLTLGAGHLDRAALEPLLRTFLATPAGPGRHARRVDKIHALGAYQAAQARSRES